MFQQFKMRMPVIVVILICGTILGCRPNTDPGPKPTVEAYFKAMRERDKQAMSALFDNPIPEEALVLILLQTGDYSKSRIADTKIIGDRALAIVTMESPDSIDNLDIDPLRLVRVAGEWKMASDLSAFTSDLDEWYDSREQEIRAAHKKDASAKRKPD